MSWLSRLPDRLQQALHGPSAAEVQDDGLRHWLDSQRGVPRAEAKAAARTLNEVCAARAARVDLRHLQPATIDALPDSLIRRMAPHADHLLLPDGCHPDRVMRMIEPLCLSTLSAYGMTGRTAPWRDDHLPDRLTMIHSDRLPVPESDLIGTHRLYDIQDRKVAAHLEDHPRRAVHPPAPQGGAAPGRTNSLEDYVRAASIARDLVHWSAARRPGESSTTMSADSAATWRGVLDRVDAGLLSPKAARVCQLIRAWLDEGTTARLSPVRVSQLALAATAMAHAFTADTPDGAALASPGQLAHLQKRRLWIEDAPDLHVRTDREMLLSKELNRRAPEFFPASGPGKVASGPTAARGPLGSNDSGFVSGGSWQSGGTGSAEVDYINTRRPTPVYAVPQDPASRPASGARSDARSDTMAETGVRDRATEVRLRGRPLSPLPLASVVDAAEVVLRPLRRTLDVKAGRGDGSVLLGDTQRARLSDALARTGDVFPPRLVAARERALHSLHGEGHGEGQGPRWLSAAQARDLIAVFDALRELSSQTRGDDERPALPRRPRPPQG